jgi:AcrR family transcriptional regulator
MYRQLYAMSSRSDRTRLAILEAAGKRLSIPGDPARLEDIAGDAGVTRQSVYLHFGTRGALLIALARQGDETLGLTDRIAEIRACPDPVEALSMLLRLIVMHEPRIHGQAMAAARLAPTDPDVAAALEDRMQHRREQLSWVLRAIKRSNLLAPGWSVRQVADLLWEASAPSSYHHLVVERGWSPEAFERWLFHLGRSFLVKS